MHKVHSKNGNSASVTLHETRSFPHKVLPPLLILYTRNPTSRASKRARLVAMYIVTSEAVSFLPEVVDQI